jgi:hypothetical protein
MASDGHIASILLHHSLLAGSRETHHRAWVRTLPLADWPFAPNTKNHDVLVLGRFSAPARWCGRRVLLDSTYEPLGECMMRIASIP